MEQNSQTSQSEINVELNSQRLKSGTNGESNSQEKVNIQYVDSVSEGTASQSEYGDLEEKLHPTIKNWTKLPNHWKVLKDTQSGLLTVYDTGELDGTNLLTPMHSVEVREIE